MIDKDLISNIVEEQLKDTELFLVEVKVTKDNKISVIIDSDSEVDIQDCIDLSHDVEEKLDRDKEDFELSVLSFGVGEKLKFKRQYKKNIGRDIEIVNNENEKIIGKLQIADDNQIVIQRKEKKQIVQITIAYQDIESGKIIIVF
jgi:Uncharacterized protein conserved in bacteria